MLYTRKTLFTTWLYQDASEDNMGNAISTREVFNDWRVCGVSSAVPSIRRLSEESGLLSPNQSDTGMDDTKLEADCDGASTIEHISFRRLRDAVGIAQKDSVHNRIRRLGIGALAVWCLTTLFLSVQTLYTVHQMHEMLNAVQQLTKQEESRLASHNQDQHARSSE